MPRRGAERFWTDRRRRCSAFKFGTIILYNKNINHVFFTGQPHSVQLKKMIVYARAPYFLFVYKIAKSKLKYLQCRLLNGSSWSEGMIDISGYYLARYLICRVDLNSSITSLISIFKSLSVFSSFRRYCYYCMLIKLSSANDQKHIGNNFPLICKYVIYGTKDNIITLP